MSSKNQKEISKLWKLIDKQSKAIDKAINTSKILRNYLEFPHKIAECASLNRKPFSNIDAAYIGGYEQALLDIRKALDISYATEEETKQFLDEIDRICKDGL